MTNRPVRISFCDKILLIKSLRLIGSILIYKPMEGGIVMARPFSTIDAKRIIERHQNIIEKMNNAVSSVEKYSTKAKDASDA